MKVTCQACNASFLAPDDKIRGRVAKYNCRTCGSVIVADGTSLDQVPAAASPAAAAAPSSRGDGWSEPPMAGPPSSSRDSLTGAPRDSMAGWEAVPVEGALPRLAPPSEPVSVASPPKSFSIEVDVEISKPSGKVDDARPTERSAPPGDSLDDLDWGDSEPTSRSEPPAPIEAQKPASAFAFPLFGAAPAAKPSPAPAAADASSGKQSPAAAAASSGKQSPAQPAAKPVSPAPPAVAEVPDASPTLSSAEPAPATPRPAAAKPAEPAPRPAAGKPAEPAPRPAAAKASPSPFVAAAPESRPSRVSVIPAPLTDEILIDEIGDERDGPPSGLTDLRALRGDRASDPPSSSGPRSSRVDFDDLLSLSGPPSPSPALAPSPSPLDWGAVEAAPLWGPPPGASAPASPKPAAEAATSIEVPKVPEAPKTKPVAEPARGETDRPAVLALEAAPASKRGAGKQASGRKGMLIAAALGAVVLGGGVLALAGGKGQDSPSTLAPASRAVETQAAQASSAAVAADTARKQADDERGKTAEAQPEPPAAAAPAAADRAPEKPSSADRPAGGDKGEAKKSADRPSSDKPAEKHAEKAADKPADKPADKAVEKPADKPAAPAGGEFNRDAARAALSSAASSALGCGKPDGPKGVAKVSITFAPSGRVTQSTVNGPPFAGTAVGGCIAATFRRATVPPFSGDAVAVTKTVQIQ